LSNPIVSNRIRNHAGISLIRQWKQIKEYKQLLLMIIPAILYFMVFHYTPLYGVVIAFKDFQLSKGILGSPWVGIGHFKEVFSDPSFINALKNTILISLLKLFFGFPLPILFALLLNEVYHSSFKKIVQTLSFLPHFISWVVLSGIFISILSLDGSINLILVALGHEPKLFLTDEHLFIPILIITDIWKGFGWGAIIYLAALAGVDQTLYEAAYIDGANRFQRIRYITIPSISNAIVIMLILSTSGILDAGFDQIFNLQNPMVVQQSEIIDTLVYKKGLVSSDYSYATAVGLFKSAVAFILIVISNKIVGLIRGKGESIW
jgi:putative aldouronate transport system permease protein